MDLFDRDGKHVGWLDMAPDCTMKSTEVAGLICLFALAMLMQIFSVVVAAPLPGFLMVVYIVPMILVVAFLRMFRVWPLIIAVVVMVLTFLGFCTLLMFIDPGVQFDLSLLFIAFRYGVWGGLLALILAMTSRPR